MHKCPFCQYDNEDGALFCEQCKSDLGAGQAVAVAEHPPEAAEVPMAGAVDDVAEHIAEAEEVPLAAPIESPAHEENGAHTDHNMEKQAAVVAEAAPVHAEPLHAEPPVVEAAPAPQAAAEAAPAAAAAPAAEAAAPPAESTALPAGAQPRLLVLRGLKLNVEYPLYEGLNFIGRADEKPVDIDLEDQEPPDRVWSSRQHAVINFEEGKLAIEDLNSSNGTFVNRARIYPNQKRPLNLGDIIQIGTVQLKVKA